MAGLVDTISLSNCNDSMMLWNSWKTVYKVGSNQNKLKKPTNIYIYFFYVKVRNNGGTPNGVEELHDWETGLSQRHRMQLSPTP